MNRFVLALALTSLVLPCASCHKADASPTPQLTEPPADEVWLTEKQIVEGKIAVAPLSEQDVDDKIATSGRIAFDDLRVAHVFSPVTGKVIRIDAQVGQRVKKGDALAVLESPDVGMASADLSKAQAEFTAAEHDYQREKALWEKPEGHATSQKDFEASEDAFFKAKAELARARQKAVLLGGGGSVSQAFTLRRASRARSSRGT